MVINIIVFFVLAYSFLIVFFAIGMLKMPLSKGISDNYPYVSLLITSKNEEIDLPDCITALSKLDYPTDKLQIILIDDNSDDNTLEILKSAASEHENIECYTADDFPKTNLEAKARGIARAASKATGDWLFITDSDGRVPTTWLKHMLDGIDDSTGLIVSMTETIRTNWHSVLEQTAGYITMVAGFGPTGWGISMIGLGPNMAIRRKCYEDAGGLENSNFTVAEDMAIFKMVKAQGKTVKYHTDASTLVKLTPVPTFKHIISQQRRWIKGGFEGDLKDWIGFLFLFAFGFIIALFYLGFLMIGWAYEPTIYLQLLAVKLSVDFIMLLTMKIRIKSKKILRLTPFVFFYTLISYVWLPLSFLFDRKIAWMGDGYKIDYK